MVRQGRIWIVRSAQPNRSLEQDLDLTPTYKQQCEVTVTNGFFLVRQGSAPWRAQPISSHWLLCRPWSCTQRRKAGISTMDSSPSCCLIQDCEPPNLSSTHTHLFLLRPHCVVLPVLILEALVAQEQVSKPIARWQGKDLGVQLVHGQRGDVQDDPALVGAASSSFPASSWGCLESGRKKRRGRE